MFFLFYLLNLLVCYYDGLYFYNNICQIMKRGESMDFKMDKNEDKINKEDMSMIECLITESDDDSEFGRFLARTNKRSFEFIEIVQALMLIVMGIINWVMNHLFIMCLIFGFAVTALAYIM